MIKALKLVLFLLFFLFVFQFPVFAASNFSADYNITYTVDQSADSHVVINATLKNLTGRYYASSYKITVALTDIKNVKASDEGGPIIPVITKSSNETTIDVNFNKRIVGLNKTLPFQISFDTNEIAKDLQNIWEINIPGIPNTPDISSFNVTVNYPPNLGEPSYIKPAVQNLNAQPGKLTFTKNDLGNLGISISFGSYQIYNMDLKYHLQNKNIFSVSSEIALPPDSNYQKVIIDSISPKPVNVTVDKDGNWLAKFTIPPNKIINIDVKGKVKVFLNPQPQSLSASLETDYLKSQKYWNTDNPNIVKLAKELKTPQAIYEYVLKTLHYDFSRVETDSPRLGAVAALANPNSAVCLEFTDLFIALSRAAGIPAREVDGYGFSGNTPQRPISNIEDVLHAWPEYYDFDKNTWIMVDPTWGNTTGGTDYFHVMDFDHIAFVIKGESSEYPVPAGGYKISDTKNTKDIYISVGSGFNENPIANADISVQKLAISGFPFSAGIDILNDGNVAINHMEIDSSTGVLTPKAQKIYTGYIPPYGTQQLSLNFNRISFLTNVNDTIRITVGNKSLKANIKLVPIYENKLFYIGGIVFVSFCIIVSIIAYLYRRLSVFRQKR